MRLEKKKAFCEADTAGTKLIVVSGTIGERSRRQVKSLPSARAARAALRQLAREKMAAGFVEVKASQVRQEIAGFYEEPPDGRLARHYARKLAQLDRFASYGPKLRKLVDRRIDVDSERALYRYHLAAEAFRKADRAYWQRTDASDLPYMGMSWPFSGEYFFTNQAMENPTRERKQGPPVDFGEAEAQLQRVRSGGICEVEIQMMLAIIAMRRGDYGRALRQLRPATGDVLGARCLIGCIHYLKGQLKQAHDWFQRASSTPNLGFLAEKRGAFDEAAEHYLDVADSGLSTPREYAKARLRLLVASKGRKWLNAKLRARELKRKDGKILIEDPREFHSKFPEIADALRARFGIRDKRQPMREKQIAAIRLATLRRGRSAGVPVTEAMKTILRYDNNFTLFARTKPLLSPITRCKRRPVPSVDIEKLVRSELFREEPVFRAIAKLPKRVPVWNDNPKLPACIELDSPGDQRVFVYVGEPDAEGEYPIARFDDQPEVWINEASLIHHILRAAEDVVYCESVNFDKDLKRAKQRNNAHREDWSDHPELQALLALY